MLTEIGRVEIEVPLESVYPVVFIDAIFVKIRDSQVTNRSDYVAVGVTCGGERDILGLWAGDGGEGAKFWLSVLTEIQNRGTGDVCIVVCDGRKGLLEAVNTVWDRAVIKTCVIHLLRNTFRFASRKYWDQIAKDIRPVYTAPAEAAAKERFVEFTTKWEAQRPAIIRCGRTPAEFVPFLDYDVEIRRVICSTNAVESIDASYRRAIRARGHLPMSFDLRGERSGLYQRWVLRRLQNWNIGPVVTVAAAIGRDEISRGRGGDSRVGDRHRLLDHFHNHHATRQSNSTTAPLRPAPPRFCVGRRALEAPLRDISQIKC